MLMFENGRQKGAVDCLLFGDGGNKVATKEQNRRKSVKKRSRKQQENRGKLVGRKLVMRESMAMCCKVWLFCTLSSIPSSHAEKENRKTSFSSSSAQRSSASTCTSFPHILPRICLPQQLSLPTGRSTKVTDWAEQKWRRKLQDGLRNGSDLRYVRMMKSSRCDLD